jgi:hypothetical protein
MSKYTLHFNLQQADQSGLFIYQLNDTAYIRGLFNDNAFTLSLSVSTQLAEQLPGTIHIWAPHIRNIMRAIYEDLTVELGWVLNEPNWDLACERIVLMLGIDQL